VSARGLDWTTTSCAGAVLVAFTLVLAAPSVESAEPPTLEDRAMAIEQAAARPDGDRVVLGHISRKLRIPTDTLRSQRARTGRGWGELLIGNRLAALTGRPFEELVAELGTGGSWAEIAGRHGVDVSALLTYVQQSQETIEQRSEDRGPAPATADAPTAHSGGGGAHHRH
jgi:hypothetical protein